MDIIISLSSSDLGRIKDVLGITRYDDIHTSIIDAFGNMLDKEESKIVNSEKNTH